MQQNEVIHRTTGIRIQKYHRETTELSPQYLIAQKKNKICSSFGYFLHKSMENIVLYDDF